jgi:hypothetical protein
VKPSQSCKSMPSLVWHCQGDDDSLTHGMMSPSVNCRCSVLMLHPLDVQGGASLHYRGVQYTRTVSCHRGV